MNFKEPVKPGIVAVQANDELGFLFWNVWANHYILRSLESGCVERGQDAEVEAEKAVWIVYPRQMIFITEYITGQPAKWDISYLENDKYRNIAA